VIVKYAHCRSHKKLTLQELAAKLRREGFNAIFATARQMVAEELGPLGLVAPWTFGRLKEAFVSTDREQAILAEFNKINTNDSAGDYLFDFVVLSKTRSLEMLFEALRKATDLELLDHSSREEILIQDVRHRITSVSPNGKLLEEKRIRDAAKALEDDRVREQIREISAAVGATFIPRSNLEKLPTLAEPGAIDGLVKIGALTANFQIQCKNCQAALLVFTRCEDANRDLNGPAKCPCGKSNLHIVEAYGVESSHQQALQ
jgi:hypothetical protein